MEVSVVCSSWHGADVFSVDAARLSLPSWCRVRLGRVRPGSYFPMCYFAVGTHGRVLAVCADCSRGVLRRRDPGAETGASCTLFSQSGTRGVGLGARELAWTVARWWRSLACSWLWRRGGGRWMGGSPAHLLAVALLARVRVGWCAMLACWGQPSGLGICRGGGWGSGLTPCLVWMVLLF